MPVPLPSDPGQGCASPLRLPQHILKYRCPGQRDAAFAGAQRAISFIRANAVNFNVDPTQLGIIGYSAGAHLAVRVSTNHAKTPAAADPHWWFAGTSSIDTTL